MSVAVVYRKFDGALHWHMAGHRLGRDQYGVWLGCPGGTVGRRGSNPPVTWADPYVQLLPDDQWWTATCNAAPNRTEVYCDIATVPQWDGDQVSMIDLDLDVIRRRDGTTFIDDEDEFALHQVRYGYPDHIIAAARASADRLYERVAAGDEPFGRVRQAWLQRLAELGPADPAPCPSLALD